jgi:hypothetical protein
LLAFAPTASATPTTATTSHSRIAATTTTEALDQRGHGLTRIRAQVRQCGQGQRPNLFVLIAQSFDECRHSRLRRRTHPAELIGGIASRGDIRSRQLRGQRIHRNDDRLLGDQRRARKPSGD